MNNYIVTTTIYPPSKASMMFEKMDDWVFIIVGDLKTPHELYSNLENVFYLSPEYQDKYYRELSDAIGWNCIMRRNIGFIEAYRHGADVVATVDDDNIPYLAWGVNDVGHYVESHIYESDGIAFDPLSVTNHPELWHRGFPIQDVSISRNPRMLGRDTRRVMIQANLWDGDPDIDAVCRYVYNPTGLTLTCPWRYSSDQFTPFNSQNTFLDREVLPAYMVLPHVGRMDDIWGGYIAQHLLNIRPVFSKPTVYQDRNAQNIDKNMADEVFGNLNTKKLLEDISNFEKYLPEKTKEAFYLYRKAYD